MCPRIYKQMMMERSRRIRDAKDQVLVYFWGRYRSTWEWEESLKMYKEYRAWISCVQCVT
jgi:hypothetical protein